jgi:RNA-directed DNA polymerase
MQQLSFFDFLDKPFQTSVKIELSELFAAYFNSRSHKRNTLNVLRFEADDEQNLIVVLCDEINRGTYQPGKSIAFMVDKSASIKT